MTVVPDLAVPDALSMVDLAGQDLTKLDLANADLYTPLFSAPMPFTVESGPIFLATADLDNDGKRDLVVANTNDPNGPDGDPSTMGDNVPSTVSVLLGNGDGTFKTKMSTNIDAFPRGIAIANLNGDGFLDVVVAVDTGFDVLLGATGGVLGTPSLNAIATNYVRSIVVGDLDGDGNLDAVLADLGVSTGKVWVAPGNGNGTFGTAVSHEVTSTATVFSTIAARLGDMDNDGKLDLVSVNSEYPSGATNTVSIITNTSTGAGVFSFSATPTEITAAAGPSDLLITQLDGANKLDMVVSNFDGNSVSVFLSDSPTVGTLSYANPANYSVPGGPRALAFGDVDTDTKVDIIVADATSSNVTVLYGGGAGVFGQSTSARPGMESYPSGNNPVSLIAATFNSDIKIDVATADQNAGTVSVLLNQR